MVKHRLYLKQHICDSIMYPWLPSCRLRRAFDAFRTGVYTLQGSRKSWQRVVAWHNNRVLKSVLLCMQQAVASSRQAITTHQSFRTAACLRATLCAWQGFAIQHRAKTTLLIKAVCQLQKARLRHVFRAWAMHAARVNEVRNTAKAQGALRYRETLKSIALTAWLTHHGSHRAQQQQLTLASTHSRQSLATTTLRAWLSYHKAAQHKHLQHTRAVAKGNQLRLRQVMSAWCYHVHHMQWQHHAVAAKTYDVNLLRKVWASWQSAVQQSTLTAWKLTKASRLCQRLVLQRTFQSWRSAVQQQHHWQHMAAHHDIAGRVRKAWGVWRTLVADRQCSHDDSKQHADLALLSKVVRHWVLWCTRRKYMMIVQRKIASRHANRTMR